MHPLKTSSYLCNLQYFREKICYHIRNVRENFEIKKVYVGQNFKKPKNDDLEIVVHQ